MTADTAVKAVIENQLAVARATERVTLRDIAHLRAQQAAINDLLLIADQRRSQAVNDIASAEAWLRSRREPRIVDSLQFEHRGNRWRGQAREVWRWIETFEIFAWSWDGREGDESKIGAPYTEIVE
jgi:hypothetical protein